MKKIMLTGIASVLSLSAMSQAAQPAAETSFLNDPLLPLYVTAAAVSLLLILVILITLYVIKVLNFMTAEAARQNAVQTGIVYAPKPSWWKTFVEKMNASVPVAQEKEIEMDHAYDGIRELDNHLPPWWKWLFYGTIVWAVVYFILFHVTDSLPGSLEEYQRELALAE
ncbi:MAG: cbb3-type cytochrome c oxidase N-terminal domain-containing protein, partial [Chryseosolibacter sp.]